MLLLLSLLAALPVSASPDFPAPRLHENSLELHHQALTLSYNPTHKQSDWVFYALGAHELRNCADRSENFRPDPLVPAGDSAQLADYARSGFDRGHLSPAGDNKWDESVMAESFLLSNVSPQPPSFNRGIWGRLENLVRAWGKNMNGLWVATGPVLRGALGSIGASHVSTPDFFYKVLATQTGDTREAIALVLPTDASGDLSRYVKTVREVEAITGLDFLDGLPGEAAAKETVHTDKWDFHASFRYFPCNAVAPAGFAWAWGVSQER